MNEVAGILGPVQVEKRIDKHVLNPTLNVAALVEKCAPGAHERRKTMIEHYGSKRYKSK